MFNQHVISLSVKMTDFFCLPDASNHLVHLKPVHLYLMASSDSQNAINNMDKTKFPHPSFFLYDRCFFFDNSLFSDIHHNILILLRMLSLTRTLD